MFVIILTQTYTPPPSHQLTCQQVPGQQNPFRTEAAKTSNYTHLALTDMQHVNESIVCPSNNNTCLQFKAEVSQVVVNFKQLIIDIGADADANGDYSGAFGLLNCKSVNGK